jgi:hypothetical protein
MVYLCVTKRGATDTTGTNNVNTSNNNIGKKVTVRNVTVFAQESNTGYYPPVEPIKSGKYGRYACMNGINRSEKFMTENGFSVVTMTNVEVDQRLAIWYRKNSEAARQSEQAEMNGRIETLRISGQSKPVEIRHNAGEICKTASLNDTNMIDAYRGCGKGTAYVKDNFVHAFHYGYRLPVEASLNLELAGYIAVRVELSGCQICFF